jgi:hypothetical protein
MKSSSQSSQQGTIDLLNSFLRGEISAVETYRQAIEKLSDDPIPELRENQASHQRRVELLQREIMNLGGVPESGSGAWGAFTRLIEGGATLLGRGPALAALEEGEDRGLAQYRKDLNQLPGATRLLVESDLLADQQRTHDRMSRVKRLNQST